MRTDLCDQFGIDVPLFAFSHCRDVVAAVSRAGGLGVLGALAFSPEQLEIELAWIEKNVDGKPYGVDVVMPANYAGKDQGLGQGGESGDVDAAAFERLIPRETRDWIEGVLQEYEVPPLPGDVPNDFGSLLGWTDAGGRNHVDVALKHPGVALLANALGPPPRDVIEAAHAQGIKVAALVGKVEHARRQVEQGVDVIVAQGTEAGGHTGEIGSIVLVPDVVDAVAPTPVLAAGGIASGRQAAAAMALGAQGVWTGSVWLTVAESDMIPELKEKLRAAQSHDAVRSRSLSGKPARMLRTAWTQAWEREDSPGTLPMPLQYMACAEANARIMRYARDPKSRARELLGIPVGQVVGRMNEEPRAADVVLSFMEEFVAATERLQATLEAAEKKGRA